ncbi:MAG: hypothetical protein IKP63_02500, partial [Paludibacteraceae bacterium]|nr:hypothetical protein [Paludibacteraceae bacterium]
MESDVLWLASNDVDIAKGVLGNVCEYEIDEDFVFFICNPGDEKIENTNKNLVPLGYDDDCSVSTEE